MSSCWRRWRGRLASVASRQLTFAPSSRWSSAPNPVPAGEALNLALPVVPVRPLSAYSLEAIR